MEPLKFIVAPHIVQDLGLNLYTSLPRVLVEFVANAYDADSSGADILADKTRIDEEREKIKLFLEAKKKASKQRGDSVPESEEQTLPEDVQIIIQDQGQGMNREDLRTKFLVAGRRRREAEKKVVSENGRLLMGRKGLGKLAGFGVARKVTLITRKQGDPIATKIVLDYDELLKYESTHEIPIKEEELADGGGLNPSGTRIILSRLLYEPMKASLNSIGSVIADHFSGIENEGFDISVNGKKIDPPKRVYKFCWPNPSQHEDDVVPHTYDTEDGRTVTFRYRIRFTEKSLAARERGVRVYAHNRLAAAPDLQDLKTGMHGFRNVEYLDCRVYADSIDNQPVDYIATDRQSLRWETPLLSPMRQFLGERMVEACVEYQKKRDEEYKEKARDDDFTKNAIEGFRLPKFRKDFAYRVAALMASATSGGFKDPEYQTQLTIFVEGLAQAGVFKTLSELAAKAHPELTRVIAEITELTAREFGDFVRFVEGRLDGITALKTICKEVDFRKANNENQLHGLFNQCPWLIKAEFSQLLTSNLSMNTLYERLSRELSIGTYSKPSKAGNGDDRPDLVFLLGNQGLNRLVIIELKAPNTPLEINHLLQLQDYIGRSKTWLSQHGHHGTKVSGILIGSKPPAGSDAKGARLLRQHIAKGSPDGEWEVMDVLEVLTQTEMAHKELLEISERRSKADGLHN